MYKTKRFSHIASMDCTSTGEGTVQSVVTLKLYTTKQVCMNVSATLVEKKTYYYYYYYYYSFYYHNYEKYHVRYQSQSRCCDACPPPGHMTLLACATEMGNATILPVSAIPTPICAILLDA